MSLINIEREYSDTRRTLAAFLCFLAAFICLEAASDPGAIGPIHGFLAISAAGGLLLALGSALSLYNLWRSSHRGR